jgi:hypothetical protein
MGCSQRKIYFLLENYVAFTWVLETANHVNLALQGAWCSVFFFFLEPNRCTPDSRRADDEESTAPTHNEGRIHQHLSVGSRRQNARRVEEPATAAASTLSK